MSFLTDNLLSIVVALIVLLIYLKFKKKLNYFIDRDLPYIVPTWKDMLDALSLSAINDVPTEMYRRTEGDERPYYGIFLGFLKPAIMIKDPALVESILIKDFSHFQDHGFDFDIDTNPLAGHLFNMKGDKWRTLRHKLVPTFTSGKLKGMIPIMEDCADKLVQEMEADASLKTDVNLKTLFKKYSLSVIASCAFGIEPESIKDPDCQFRKIMNEFVNPTLLTRLKFMVILLNPTIARLTKLRMFSEESENFILSLTRQSLQMRKESGRKRNDFIDLLLELKEKGSVHLDIKDLEDDEKNTISNMEKEPLQTKLEFTNELLAAQVFVFLIGGFENTAYVVSITQYLLSKNPSVQKRVRDEVLKVTNKHGKLDYHALREMTLLGACIDEALRMYPAAMVFFRECNKSYTLPDGKKMEKGTTVLLPAKSYHSDSRYWSNPEEFNPDRFSSDSITSGSYLPFGDGPRICIAQRMALLIVKLLMAKLVLKYELQPSPKTKEPIKITATAGADNEGGFWGSFQNIN